MERIKEMICTGHSGTTLPKTVNPKTLMEATTGNERLGSDARKGGAIFAVGSFGVSLQGSFSRFAWYRT